MMNRLGVKWVKVEPRTLRRFFGIDYIFLYQFGVYVGIWVWAICHVITAHRIAAPLFLVAPPVVFVGYMVPRKWGIILCAAGDAAMAWGTAYEAYLIHSHNQAMFAVVLTGLLALCMAARFIRDVVIYLSPHAQISDLA